MSCASVVGSLVSGSPVPPLSSSQPGGLLDKATEAIAHPILAHPSMHTPPTMLDAHDSGSLHAATMNAMDEHIRHPISPEHRAKAAEFIHHLDQLVAGLRAKSHIAQLTRKYPGSRSAAENATLAHEEAELAQEEAQAAAVGQMGQLEEDEFGRLHAPGDIPPMHAPAGSKAATVRARIQNRLAATKAAAHIPQQTPVGESHAPRQQDAHLPQMPPSDPEHPSLDPVPDNQRRRIPSPSDAGYVLHPIQLAPSSDLPSGVNFTTFVYPTTQGNVTIYVGITEYPLGKFHIFPSPRDEMDEISLVARLNEQQRQSTSRAPILTAFLEERARLNPLCDGVATTSESARAYNCLLAMNAGFFDMQTDACLGNVVSNDQWINHAGPELATHAHFGLTRKGNYLTGFLTSEELAGDVDGGFHELIQGSGWLVRDGRNYLHPSTRVERIANRFVEQKAPRNAIGHDREGRLLMFEADGEEDIRLGLTLSEFADLLTHHFDVVNAINVDGGGSSTTVYKGDVVDRPTCRDTPQVCERPVTTITCVMP